MFGSLLFGIGTLRAGMVPRLGAWLLTLGGFPGIVLMTVLVGHLSGGLPLLDFAWVVLGYALWTQRGGPAVSSPRVR
jgi:peptidoglycan/LPS O-acetylase OafA/YrhL